MKVRVYAKVSIQEVGNQCTNGDGLPSASTEICKRVQITKYSGNILKICLIGLSDFCGIIKSKM